MLWSPQDIEDSTLSAAGGHYNVKFTSYNLLIYDVYTLYHTQKNHF